MAPTGLLEASTSSRLSELEDEQVVVRARGGCAQATNYLLRKYKGLVEGKARSYFLAGAEQDDVVQEGMIGLFKAIRDYQSGKIVQFRSFAELCVTRQIITAIKAATRNKHMPLNDCVSLQGSLTSDDGGGSLRDMVGSRVADPERILLEMQTLRFVNDRQMTGLSDLEHEVLQGYLAGYTYQERAREMGRPAKTIANALQRAQRKVGRYLYGLN
jgi:RNA polymerase sporulation-specific sigma factor